MLGLPEILLRLGNAMALGILVGLERELHDRPAGLRTHLVVALASTVFMIVSMDFTYYQPGGGLDGGLRSDPARIASYVVAGMGFLGAGTIIRGGRGVKGLTTASTLWFVAALGLAVGAGMFGLAWSSCVMALVALVGFRGVERLLERCRTHPVKRMARVELRDRALRGEVLERIRELGVHASEEDYDLDAGTGRLRLKLGLRLGKVEDVAELVERVGMLPGVARFEVLRGNALPGEED